MNGEPRVTVRSDVARVVRAIARYAATDYEPGSAAGRWAIHETRREAEGIDLEEASTVEVLEAIYRAELRRAVYAPPAPRLERPTPGARLDADRPLRCVAPRKLVAHVLPVRTTRFAAGGDTGMRAWRLTFAVQLGKLPKVCETVLLEVARGAAEHVYVRNTLTAKTLELERLPRGNGKTVVRLRREAEAEVRDLRAKEREWQERLDETIRSREYRFGLRELARIIARSPAVEREIFGEP